MDIVGHDIGALITMRIASALGVPLRRFAVDVAPIFHPRFILDFYRSAVPNIAAEWWEDAAGARRARGLVLLLPDPPEEEAMSLEVAEGLGAETARRPQPLLDRRRAGRDSRRARTLLGDDHPPLLTKPA